MKLAALGLAAVLLAGCAQEVVDKTRDLGALQKEPDNISVPLQPARELYATLRSRALDNPKATLDVDKIVKILEISAKLIGAVL